ncbi:MAG: hypothetical protein ACYC8T_31925 [Myxococcaceae bacterium]
MDTGTRREELERLKRDAIARLTWGHRPEDVLATLRSSLPPQQADALLRDIVAARDAYFRGRGLRDLVVGLALFAAGAAVVFWMYRHGGGGKAIGLTLVVPVLGLVLVGRGIDRLVTGSRHERPG